MSEGSSEVEATNEQSWWGEWTVIEHVDHYVKQGFSSKEAVKQVAKDRGMNKRDVYQIYHIDNK